MSLIDTNLRKTDDLKCLLITMVNIVQRLKSTERKGAIVGIHTSIKNVFQYSARATGI